MNRSVIAVAAGIFAAAAQYAAEVRHLTLTEAVHLAISQNRALKIARLEGCRKRAEKGGRAFILFSIAQERIEPAARYGLAEYQHSGRRVWNGRRIGGAFAEYVLPQGQTTLYTSGTQLSQPLTQLIRIRDANRIAAADVAISRDDLKKAENEIALEVHSVYYGILIAKLQKQAAEQQTQYADQNLRESEDDVRNGSALKVAAIQGQATVLESRQSVLTADLQLSDLTTQLNDLLGLPLDTKLELDPRCRPISIQRSREEYVQTAWSQNPQIKAAEDAVEKAQAAVGSAKTAYIPDVTAYARQSYQDGVPFLVRNFGTFGVNMTWDVFDFGKRRAAVRERQDQLAEAEENVRRLKDEVAVSIERSYNKVQRTKSLVEVATQVVKLRQESERLAQNQLAQGEVLDLRRVARRRRQRIKRKPIFCRRISGICSRGRSFRKLSESLPDSSLDLAGLLSEVAAQRTAGDFEEPGSKQGTVSKLGRFAIHDQHHFLGQVFAERLLAATGPKKGDQLRSEYMEHSGKVVLTW
jgi:outer membrane protein TolC